MELVQGKNIDEIIRTDPCLNQLLAKLETLYFLQSPILVLKDDKYYWHDQETEAVRIIKEQIENRKQCLIQTHDQRNGNLRSQSQFLNSARKD